MNKIIMFNILNCLPFQLKNLIEDKKTKEELPYKQMTKRFVLIVTTLILSGAFLLFITLFFKDQT